MGTTPRTADIVVGGLFATGGIVNSILGVAYFGVSALIVVPLGTVVLMATLSFIVGIFCLWVAWGILHSRDLGFPIGIAVSLLGLLPGDLIPPGWPVPNLTPWATILAGSYSASWIISAPIGIVVALYLITRRRQPSAIRPGTVRR